MKTVIQRTTEARVTVDSKEIGSIQTGLVVYVGFTHDDTLEDITYIINKITNLRIFDDEEGVMNKSILDIQGSILSISQFTLYADTKKGRRPSYTESMNANEASKLYDTFNQQLSSVLPVKTGKFQADMKVSYTNDGPVTIVINSKEK